MKTSRDVVARGHLLGLRARPLAGDAVAGGRHHQRLPLPALQDIRRGAPHVTTEPVPPRVGKKHDPRACEPAATRALLAALRLAPAEAAKRTGLSVVQVAGLMAGTLRVADDGQTVKHPTLGKLGPWAKMAEALTAEGA